MPLLTNRPGMSDENSKKYYEINQKIIDCRNELNALAENEKEKRKQLEKEIQNLLMEQVFLTQSARV